MLITGFIFLLLALIALVVSFTIKATKEQQLEGGRSYETETVPDPKPNKISRLAAAGLGGIALLFFILGSFYVQDAGEAKVLKDITGNIVGQSNETGLHVKAPWVETVTFNIRDQQVVFAGKTGEQSDQAGGVANGTQITVQDAEGVSSNIDIALRYSIKPDAVTDIYKRFQSEENFKNSFIEQDVRSVVRLVPNTYSTLDLITKRGEIETAILESLEKRWSDDGVTVTSLSLQEIRPPKAVKESYADAQKAQIKVTTEEANLAAAEVSAQQKVVQATAESEANGLLAASLTPEILQQRYLDTLAALAAAGNLVVVPEGFDGLVNVGK